MEEKVKPPKIKDTDLLKILESDDDDDTNLSSTEVALYNKLSKDMVKASVYLTDAEVRYMVSTYYINQEARKRSGNQIRALMKREEPHNLISWFFLNSHMLELESKRVLSYYVSSKPEGIWLQSILGIGPVLSAGLISHIDYSKAFTAGSIWRFAGLDPTSKWEKGKKRPWNADLKVIAWKIGESFNKQCHKDKDFYGHLLVQKKKYYIEKNEKGDYEQIALERAKIFSSSSKSYVSYIKGKLPDGHIHSMAKRFATKIFLAHYLQALYEIKTGKKWEIKPYPIEHLGHAHEIVMPEEQRLLLESIVRKIHK